jgi:hypothetical protein
MGVSVRASGAEQPDHRPGLIAAAVASLCWSSRPHHAFALRAKRPPGAGTRSLPAVLRWRHRQWGMGANGTE